MSYLHPHTGQLDGPLADLPTIAVLAEVASERQQQDGKWGGRNHPDGTGDTLTLHDGGRWDAKALAEIYRSTCQTRAKGGYLSWVDILLEELFEAFAETDPAKLRVELVQVAAVAAAWIEAIDRRSTR